MLVCVTVFFRFCAIRIEVPSYYTTIKKGKIKKQINVTVAPVSGVFEGKWLERSPTIKFVNKPCYDFDVILQIYKISVNIKDTLN